LVWSVTLPLVRPGDIAATVAVAVAVAVKVAVAVAVTGWQWQGGSKGDSASSECNDDGVYWECDRECVWIESGSGRVAVAVAVDVATVAVAGWQ
jgi:hypothetical protein